MTDNAPEYDRKAFEARQKLDRALNTPTLALREIREWKARAEAAEAEALDWRAQVGELSDKLKALAAERDALQARVDAAEADLEMESEWALVQPNADPMQDPRVKALVEAATRLADLWDKDAVDRIGPATRQVRAALRDLEQGNT